jgi:hypothetical protein
VVVRGCITDGQKEQELKVVTKKKTPSWVDVKARLADIDRAGLIGLVQDLYAASKDNQAFLHTWFALKYVLALPAAQQPAFIARLDRVRRLGQDLGWGVGEDFDIFWSEAGLPGAE